VTLTFTIPGAPISGNRSRSQGRGRWFTPPAAKEYEARAKSVATAAALLARWKVPQYVRMDVTLYNTRLDRDNACKALNDALQGICYVFDSRILDGFTAKRRDKNGPRVVIEIAALDPAPYGYSKPRLGAESEKP
jgi:Holliday junction resolvase RusA-like endonuclease